MVSAVIVGALPRYVAARDVLAVHVADQSVTIVDIVALSVAQVWARTLAHKNDADVENDSLGLGKRKRMTGHQVITERMGMPFARVTEPSWCGAAMSIT